MCTPARARKVKNQTTGRRQASLTSAGMYTIKVSIFLRIPSSVVVWRQLYSGNFVTNILFKFGISVLRSIYVSLAQLYGQFAVWCL